MISGSVLVLVPSKDVNVRVLAVEIDPCASVHLIVAFKGSNVEAQIGFSQGALLVPWLFCFRSFGFKLGVRSVIAVKQRPIPAILPSVLQMREILCSQTRVGSTRNGKRKISIPPKKPDIRALCRILERFA